MIKEVNQDRFYSKLSDKAYKMRFPLRVMFELTYNCNLRCRHCYNVRSDKKELTTKQVFSILRQLKNVGCFYLGFTGGEVFTRKDIFDILWQAKRYGFSIAVLTNGTLIDEKKANLLSEIGVNKIDISLHGATKKTYEYITKVKNSFEKCMNAINLLRERKIPIYLKTNLMTKNIKEFGRIKNLAKRLLLRFRYDPSLTPKTDGSKEPLKLRIGPKKVADIKRRYFPHLIEGQKEYFLKEGCNLFREKALFRCGAGRSELTISPYGRLKVCPDMPYPDYDILKGNLRAGWQKVIDFVDSTRPDENFKCNTCDFSSFCRWCPAKGFLEMRDMSKCVPYYKELARIEKQLIAPTF